MAVMESSVVSGLEESAAADLAVASLALARRFAAGATMWCVAPQWPSHGRHVAVEFVHPVIMGKRALSAVSVGGADAIRSRAPGVASRRHPPRDEHGQRHPHGRPAGAMQTPGV